MKLTIGFFTGIVVLLNCISCNVQEEQPVTLAIINANIWTADEKQPHAEALAISNDKIIRVGTTREINKMINDKTRVIDANGMFVCPGFTDSHLHLLDGGFHLSSVQLRDAATPEEFTRRIAEYAKTLEPGEWILGGDWDHSL